MVGIPERRGDQRLNCALIIDAMDLMYTGRFDGMCLVSSDSDFTRLAQRLRYRGVGTVEFPPTMTPQEVGAAYQQMAGRAGGGAAGGGRGGSELTSVEAHTERAVFGRPTPDPVTRARVLIVASVGQSLDAIGSAMNARMSSFMLSSLIHCSL